MRLSVGGYGADFCNTGVTELWGRVMRGRIILAGIVLLAGCGGGPVGGERDQYGCLIPAGYQWCPAIEECVRSWELVEERGLEKTPEAYEAFCLGIDTPD